MATIEDFMSWIERDITRFSPSDNHMIFSGSVGDESASAGVDIYTDNNRYRILADEKSGYLGCSAKSRKPRAGEDWQRGSDLADGPLDESTWRRILGDIVSYEMVRVRNRPDVGETLSS